MASRASRNVVPIQSSKKKTAAKSIQAEKRTTGNSYAARMNREALKHAYNHGKPWDEQSVTTLTDMIDADDTVINIARATGRSFYSAGAMCWAMRTVDRHRGVIKKWLNKPKKKGTN